MDGAAADRGCADEAVAASRDIGSNGGVGVVAR
jgi:hypothetical protein